MLDFSLFTAVLVLLKVDPGKLAVPEACFQPFRWDDCGRAPEAKMYYWKPRSSCEIGMWRGCLPNMNMFDDEEACERTCVFGKRAQAIDFHQNENDIDYLADIDDDDDSIQDITTVHNKGTDGTDTGNSTDKGHGTDSGNDTNTENGTNIDTTTENEDTTNDNVMTTDDGGMTTTGN